MCVLHFEKRPRNPKKENWQSEQTQIRVYTALFALITGMSIKPRENNFPDIPFNGND